MLEFYIVQKRKRKLSYEQCKDFAIKVERSQIKYNTFNIKKLKEGESLGFMRIKNEYVEYTEQHFYDKIKVSERKIRMIEAGLCKKAVIRLYCSFANKSFCFLNSKVYEIVKNKFSKSKGDDGLNPAIFWLEGVDYCAIHSFTEFKQYIRKNHNKITYPYLLFFDAYANMIKLDDKSIIKRIIYNKQRNKNAFSLDINVNNGKDKYMRKMARNVVFETWKGVFNIKGVVVAFRSHGSKSKYIEKKKNNEHRINRCRWTQLSKLSVNENLCISQT